MPLARTKGAQRNRLTATLEQFILLPDFERPRIVFHVHQILRESALGNQGRPALQNQWPIAVAVKSELKQISFL